MIESGKLRYTKFALNNGSGAIPALGFGTLIPDVIATKNAIKAAPEAGFRGLDTAERYGTEREVGEAMKEVFKAGRIKREDVEEIKAQMRFNAVVETGVPGFIPRGK